MTKSMSERSFTAKAMLVQPGQHAQAVLGDFGAVMCTLSALRL
jgi:hypothetical protein